MSDFWTRRRKAVEAEAEAERAAEAEAEVAEERTALEDLPESDVLERLGLPDPDSIGPGDDVAGFMRDVVPAALRSRALRRLWTSNPILANLDGLADYNDDFTGNGLKGRALTTAYQVGKGLTAHVEKMAEEARAAEAAEVETGDDVAEVRQENSEICDDTASRTLENPSSPPSELVTPSEPQTAYDPGSAAAPTRPRMTFAFGEDAESDDAEPAGS